MSGAWGTQAVERAPIEEIPLIHEVHIDGLVREAFMVARITADSTERSRRLNEFSASLLCSTSQSLFSGGVGR